VESNSGARIFVRDVYANILGDEPRAPIVSDRDAQRLAALSSRADLAEDVSWLRECGPRETGSPEHTRFVNWIAGQLTSLGLPVERKSYPFNCWSVPLTGSACSLTVHDAGGRNLTIPIASTYPYSGRTPPDGITAPLHLVRNPYWWFGCAGKIAVIEIPHPSVPVNVLLEDVGHLPADATGFPTTYQHPVLSAYAFGPMLSLAKRAGALGVVALWKGMSPAQAADQYVRFDLPYQEIPAVWVAGADGERLLERARKEHHATLTVAASLQGTSTDTVWTVVEGENTKESILVLTHTDGGNAVEENGAIGILQLARMFAAGPRPKRTLVFIFVTGHLHIPAVTVTKPVNRAQAATAWLKAHPQWWSGKDGAPRAVAGVVIEHLGALAHPRPAPGDAVEPAIELTYATNGMMTKIVKESWAGRQRGKTLIAKPNGLFQIGEGDPLYQEGIPAIALISVPEYLLAATRADVVDIDLMHEQIGAFARALLLLEVAPAQLLGRAERAGFLQKFRSLIRLALLVVRVRLRALT